MLDAEILAEVFLTMTGGQTSLAFSMEGEQSNQVAGEHIQRIVRPGAGLRVVSASDEEIMAHESRLDLVQRRRQLPGVPETADFAWKSIVKLKTGKREIPLQKR